jgi:hypothetical protein
MGGYDFCVREYRRSAMSRWATGIRRHCFTYGMMYGMRRTTIYLPDELKLALERTAAEQGTSEAEVVRHALIAATAQSAAPTLRIPLFDSGDATLAERVDDELAAGFGE